MLEVSIEQGNERSVRPRLENSGLGEGRKDSVVTAGQLGTRSWLTAIFRSSSGCQGWIVSAMWEGPLAREGGDGDADLGNLRLT
jgi:hypothetical protein